MKDDEFREHLAIAQKIGFNEGYKKAQWDSETEIAELKEKLKIAEECICEIHKRSVYQLGNEQKSDEWFILSCESLAKEALSKLKGSE